MSFGIYSFWLGPPVAAGGLFVCQMDTWAKAKYSTSVLENFTP
jgi:hypothetical protein